MLKRFPVPLLCLSVALPFPLFSQSTQKSCVAEIVRTSAELTIDGMAEEAWDAALPLHLTESIELYDMLDPAELSPEPDDFSGKVRFLWDESALYMLADIVDDNPQAPYTGTWFREDVVELYLDLDRSGAAGDGSYDGENDWEIGFFSMADPVEIVTGPNSVKDTDGFIAASATTSVGYRLEVAMPWPVLGLAEAPATGIRIGMDAHVVDNDNRDGVREHKLAWHGTVDEAWRDTRVLAPVRLAEPPAPVMDPVPDPQSSNGIGASLVPFVRIPDSPATGNAPRLNMVKEVPDGSGRIFAIDQLGYLYVVQPEGEVAMYLNFRDLSGFSFLYDNTQNGSTSFAFHPEFATNGKLYVVSSTSRFSGNPDFPAKRPIDPSIDNTDPRQPLFHDVLLEFTADVPAADSFSGSWREVLRIEQPYGDHNVGEVTFNPAASPGDPDYGLLYLAVADGGNQFPIDDADPENNAQDLTTVHGSIIRIDPLGTNSRNGQYGIPNDNPFVGGGRPALPEIWSYGHRNHHRLAWDLRGSGTLYAFEMGQGAVEEVNRIVRGGNYGWGDREGTFLLNETDATDLRPVPECERENLFQYPVFQYDHPQSSGAIAGGAVYVGIDVPALYGKIILADFTGNRGAFYGEIGQIADLPYATAAPLHHLDIHDDNGDLVGLSTALLGPSGTRRTDVRIHTDRSGEVLFTNKRNGWIHRMKAAPSDTTIPWQAVFAEAQETAEGFIQQTPLGPLFFEEWPWLYSPDFGWVWIEASPAFASSGVWTWFP